MFIFAKHAILIFYIFYIPFLNTIENLNCSNRLYREESWGLFTMLTQLPTYMKNSLGFDLSTSGFLSSVPYISLGIVLLFVSYLADWVQKREYLTTGQTRKYFSCAAFLAQTTFMMLTAYQTDKTRIITFLTFGAAIGSFAICGFGVNHLDIAPDHNFVVYLYQNLSYCTSA